MVTIKASTIVSQANFYIIWVSALKIWFQVLNPSPNPNPNPTPYHNHNPEPNSKYNSNPNIHSICFK
jgi:hypothetical protein